MERQGLQTFCENRACFYILLHKQNQFLEQGIFLSQKPIGLDSHFESTEKMLIGFEIFNKKNEVFPTSKLLCKATTIFTFAICSSK